MFNIFLCIQSHRKSPLHPKLCPQPGGSLGYHHHSMPVPVATSRRRNNRAGRARQPPLAPLPRVGGAQGCLEWVRSESPTHTHLWMRWRWLQPLGHLACQCNTHGCYQSSSPRRDWELISLVFSTPFFLSFSWSHAWEKKPFLKRRFFFCLFWYYSLERIMITVWQKYQIHNSENSSG